MPPFPEPVEPFSPAYCIIIEAGWTVANAAVIVVVTVLLLALGMCLGLPPPEEMTAAGADEDNDDEQRMINQPRLPVAALLQQRRLPQRAIRA